MNERWKFQVKNGLIWGLIMSSCLAVFDVFEMSFEDAFLSKKTLLRTFYFVFTGIFLISYSRWKKKTRIENNNELSHDNSVNK
jgi:predicted transporter